jgi:hypothetical protein
LVSFYFCLFVVVFAISASIAAAAAAFTYVFLQNEQSHSHSVHTRRLCAAGGQWLNQQRTHSKAMGCWVMKPCGRNGRGIKANCILLLLLLLQDCLAG